jgi:8-oxo-dGTP pyrophosphatase MutT (NUDIX family)
MSDADLYPVLHTDWIYRGKIVSLRLDTVQMDDGSSAVREVVTHPGAVGVVAIDDDGRVVMVSQYRHPVRARLDELPAGLMDVGDELPLDAARRELAEEASLHADRWQVLIDLHTSPGFSTEAIRLYLARGLRDDGRPDGFVIEGEEVGMTVSRVPLDEAVQRVLAGDITNAAAAAGILAAAIARSNDFQGLRPADAPWPGRPGQ